MWNYKKLIAECDRRISENRIGAVESAFNPEKSDAFIDKFMRYCALFAWLSARRKYEGAIASYDKSVNATIIERV